MRGESSNKAGPRRSGFVGGHGPARRPAGGTSITSAKSGNRYAGLSSVALCLILLVGGCASGVSLPSVTSTGGDSIAVTTSSSVPPTTPLPTVAATAGVRSVCLIVEAAYPTAPPLPIAETAASILEHIGLDVVVGQEVDCDAVLTVSLSLGGLGDDYGATPFTGGHNCFTGAEANGEATLAIGGEELRTLQLQDRFSPPVMVRDCPTMESHAPFDEVWRGPLASVLGEWWGIPALVAAMEIAEPPMPAAAAGVMAGMWSDANAEASSVLPILLTMFASGDPGAVEAAARAIGAMGPEAAEALPVVLDAVASQDVDRRRAAIHALGAFGAAAHDTGVPVPAEVLAALISTLEGDDAPALRVEAARMLGGMGTGASAAIPALVAAIEANFRDDQEISWRDTLGAVAEAAAKALYDLGPEGIPTLIELLDSPVGELAVASLAYTTGDTLGDHPDVRPRDPEDWRRWLEALGCAWAVTATEVTRDAGDLGGLDPGEEIGVVVEEAGFIPSSFVYSDDGYEFHATASGRFFAVRYTIRNATEYSYVSAHNSMDWLATDGRGVWEDQWFASGGWSSVQGDQDPGEVPPGSEAATWVVFDVPEAVEPAALAWSFSLAWPFEKGNQACLTWP